MQIGDAVIPKQDYCLVSGCNWYPGAIVVSLNPFVLVSTKGDMIWYKERPEDFDLSDKYLSSRKLSGFNPSR
jgi:hypothetical protein